MLSNDKSAKYLSIKVPLPNVSPIEMFKTIKEKPDFTDENNLNNSLVKPYLIITNGEEVLLVENSNSEMEIGLFYLIIKSNKKSKEIIKGIKEHFDDFMKETIFSAIEDVFEDLKIESGNKTKDNKIDGCPTEYIDATKDNTLIYSLEQSLLSIDKRYVVPIYFMILPSKKTIKMVAKQNVNVQMASLSNLAKNGYNSYTFSSIAKSILVMIANGEIVLPMEENKEKHG